jgi:hypothetical protein
MPRISIVGDAPAARPPARADVAGFHIHILTRLTALEAACKDPEKQARRLLHLLQRVRPPARPLRTDPPPGLARHCTAEVRNLFADLEAETQAAWPALVDTS